jgi:hypothetical protein
MFIHATLDLALPAATAVERLYAALRRRRLDELSDQAYQAGLITLARFGPFGDAPGLSKTVRLEVLEPRSVNDGVHVPLRWVATGATGRLFPALDADLDITAVDERRCALSIIAAYTPPLGAAGAGLDRLLLHHAAQATMRSLLKGLGRCLLTPPSAAAARSELPQIGKVKFAAPAPGAPTPEV